MKQLTYSSMAAARLRANKRSYGSLVLGIFLSIFLISTLVLSVYGIYQAYLQKRYDKAGYLDMVVLDNAYLTDEDFVELGDFERIGHAYISGCVTDKNIYLGYYDETGSALLNLSPVEGRMPENSGEIAMEASVMDVLEVHWQLGETVELDITPVDGIEETRQFTVVGILPEHSVYLEKSDHIGVTQFPAIVTSSKEAPFATGRTAFHFMLGLKKTSNLSNAIAHFWEHYLRPGIVSAMYGLSISGEQVQIYNLSEATYVEKDMFNLIRMACVLAAALILSCGVGISGAMEGVLSKRREEIGVLRALGATRRQIRKMFGRENLILALVAAPLSILISCGAVWVLSRILPESIKFVFNLWLILPIAVSSVIVILVSGYLPLVRASKLMPMSVIRDTAMLRRGKGVKSRKEFSVTKLISARQVRFHPTRQIGAALLVGLMLLCSGLLSVIVCSFMSYAVTDYPGFYVRDDGAYSGSYIQNYEKTSMSKQSLNQLRSLDHVESIVIDREMPVLVHLDAAPRYAMLEENSWQFGMLDDALFQEALSLYGNNGAVRESMRENSRKKYLQLLEDYQFSSEVFQTVIVTMEMNGKNLDVLRDYLSEGDINIDAINSGTEVLVYAPNIWLQTYETGGYTYLTSEKEANQVPNAGNAKLIAWNDCFSAGQTLPLTQLYRTMDDGAVSRRDAAVQVGGVVTNLDDSIRNFWGTTAIITTEEGLENMGLLVEGLREVQIYLDGEMTSEEETLLEQQITAISRRSEGYSVYNQVASFREQEQANRQALILILSIVTVFFVVAVGMIVSSVTRQLNSEGRTIGMLRAVGADEKAILGCYSGQLNAAVTGGLGITSGLILLFILINAWNGMISSYNPWDASFILSIMAALVTAVVMAAACWAICRCFLRLRIREIVSKSIIDNIREL